MSYTPGPWKAVPSGSGHDIVAPIMQYSDSQFINDAHMYHLPKKTEIQWRLGEDGMLYASLAYETWRQFPQAKWDEQQEANAKLMALAPDLLVACKTACSLARIKYGNLDPDVDAELTRIENLCARAEAKPAAASEER